MGFSQAFLERQVEDALEGTFEDLMDDTVPNKKLLRRLRKVDRTMHRDLAELDSIVQEWLRIRG